MANLFLLFSTFLFISASITICDSYPVDASEEYGSSLGWITTRSAPPCKGSIAECLGDDEEFDFDSEISRRILATGKYISYGALQRNSVPCSRRGASYYNCRSGGQANPYSRGCSAITRCRS